VDEGGLVDGQPDADAEDAGTDDLESILRTGCDVMITIFDEFRRKKLTCFSKTNVMIKFLHNLALSCVKKTANFSPFFCEDILKIITTVPDFDRMKISEAPILQDFVLFVRFTCTYLFVLPMQTLSCLC
jgi:hypothetical protein